MRKTAVLLVLLVIVLGGCGAKREELPLTFRNAELGFTIRHPEGWVCEYGVDHGFEVVYCWNDPGPAGPGFVLAILSAELAEPYDGDRQEAIRAIAENNISPVDECGKVQDTRVGNQPAAFVDCQWEGNHWRFVDAHLGDRLFSFRADVYDGTGEQDLWNDFIPTLEAMLASMTFFEPGTGPDGKPIPPTATPAPLPGWTSYTVTDGLPDNDVRAIAVTPDGVLWVSTDGGGVSRYMPPD
jgi:hypothetical protein